MRKLPPTKGARRKQLPREAVLRVSLYEKVRHRTAHGKNPISVGVGEGFLSCRIKMILENTLNSLSTIVHCGLLVHQSPSMEGLSCFGDKDRIC